jgi:hypothetical protein
VLDTLDVALVGMFIRGPHSDDTIWAWNFELKVGVVCARG